MDTDKKNRQTVVKSLIDRKLINDNSPVIALIDSEGIRTTVAELTHAFPDHFKHYFAVKANSYEGVLRQILRAGMAAEVASPAEFSLALKAGFDAKNMVFDAPVKTSDEIHRALDIGVSLNIDNFQEFDTIAEWMERHKTESIIGFRINPQVGAGESKKTSTATKCSKFGIGLKDKGVHDKILECYYNYPWMQSIHVHVGSIACPISLMCDGVEEAVSLVDSINNHIGHQQIHTIDIGGGLPVDFTGDDDSPTFEEYSKVLEARVPELFSGKYHVITEFGRSVIAKNGFTVSRIEYTKTMGGRSIAMSHLGVQSLMRLVFEPEHWHRRITAYDAIGNIKQGEKIPQDIAGPACFSGDLIVKQRPLPLLEPGDYILVHDTGAYCSSNHYYYNALPKIPLIGFDTKPDKPPHFEFFSHGQTIDDIVSEYEL